TSKSVPPAKMRASGSALIRRTASATDRGASYRVSSIVSLAVSRVGFVQPSDCAYETTSISRWTLRFAKRIENPNSLYHLAVVQILGPERVAAALRSGENHHRVPEVEFRFCVQGDRGHDIVGRRRKHF